MKKRITATLLCILFACVSLGAYSQESAPLAYDPEAAIQCAAIHRWDEWDNCAEYVALCLRAGGLDVTVPGCTSLHERLCQFPEIEVYRMALTNSTYLKSGKLADVLSTGDIGIYLCDFCNKYYGEPYIHTFLYTGTDEEGYIRGYSHGPQEGPNARYWYNRNCYECHQILRTIYFYHFPAPGESDSHLDASRIYFDSRGVPLSGLMDRNGVAYYLRKDGTPQPGWNRIPEALCCSNPDGRITLYATLIANTPVLQDAEGQIIISGMDAVLRCPQIEYTPLCR